MSVSALHKRNINEDRGGHRFVEMNSKTRLCVPARRRRGWTQRQSTPRRVSLAVLIFENNLFCRGSVGVLASALASRYLGWSRRMYHFTLSRLNSISP